MIVCDNCGAKNLDTAITCCECANVLLGNKKDKAVMESLNRELRLFWGGWEVISKLGHGSYGSVYLAEHRERQCAAYSAIKVITVPKNEKEWDDVLYQYGNDLAASKTHFSDIVDNCIKEVEMMITLKSSPNVVYIEDFTVRENKKTDGFGWKIFIRMELLTPFIKYKDNKILTENNIVKLGADICGALEACSKENILHRDIKPQNILVGSGGEFKIGDFGIARQLEIVNSNLTKGQGTKNYMAPEVDIGSDYDFRADIYSLGIVLYELANNNRLPFLPDKQIKDITPLERDDALKRRLSGKALPEPIGVSGDLARIILKACAFNPNKRFSSASEMKNALLNVKISDHKIVSEKNNDDTLYVRPVRGNSRLNAAEDRNDSTLPSYSRSERIDSADEKTQRTPHSAPAAEKEEKPSIFNRIFNFGKENRSESDSYDFKEVIHPIGGRQSESETVLIAGYQCPIGETSKLNIINRKLTQKDLQNIGKLKNLTALNLIKCGISSIAFIADLTGLERLCLQSNKISNLVPLRNLTNLTELKLNWNEISDITPLCGLTNLMTLDLRWNNISDVAPLRSLTNLEKLDLQYNQISDIVPLIFLSKLCFLNLNYNKITDMSQLCKIQANISFEGNPRNIKSDKTVSVTNSRCAVNKTSSLNIDDKKLTGNVRNGTPPSKLETVQIAKSQRSIDKTLSIIIVRNSTPSFKHETVLIADFQYSIATKYLTIVNKTLTNEDLKNIGKLKYLKSLKLQECGLSDVSFIADLPDLPKLELSSNKISDISPLAKLTNLRYLDLGSNKISDVAPLANLTNLRYFDLGHNKISNITPLANLTNLESLSLYSTKILDIAALTNLTNLKSLKLSFNQISDIASLANLTNLEDLWLSHNRILDVTLLANLANLRWLDLSSNQVSDIIPLANLTNLRWLDLSSNQISDVTPLANLTSLWRLTLDSNQISDVAPLEKLTNIQKIWLAGNPAALDKKNLPAKLRSKIK